MLTVLSVTTNLLAVCPWAGSLGFLRAPLTMPAITGCRGQNCRFLIPRETLGPVFVEWWKGVLCIPRSHGEVGYIGKSDSRDGSLSDAP